MSSHHRRRRAPAALRCCVGRGVMLGIVAAGMTAVTPAAAIAWGPNNPAVFNSQYHGGANAISRQDCLDQVAVQYQLADGVSGNELQLWASDDAAADCTSPVAQADGLCVLLDSKAINSGPLTVVVTSKQVAAVVSTIDGLSCTGGSSTATEVSLTFIELDTGLPVGTLFHSLSVDVTGPQSPVVNTIAAIAPTALGLEVTPAQASEPYTGLSAYCLPVDVNPCGASGLGAGQLPPAMAPSGQSSSITSISTSQLSAGVRYACGVAGRDALNNVGKLSNIACATLDPALPPDEDEPGCSCGLPRRQPSNGRWLPWIACVLWAVRRKKG